MWVRPAVVVGWVEADRVDGDGDRGGDVVGDSGSSRRVGGGVLVRGARVGALGINGSEEDCWTVSWVSMGCGVGEVPVRSRVCEPFSEKVRCRALVRR